MRASDWLSKHGAWLAPALLVASALSLLLPRLLHPMIPTSLPGFGVEEMRARVMVSRVLAALIATAGLGVLALGLHRAEDGARCTASNCGAVAAAVAIVFALPIYDVWAVSHATQSHQHSGGLNHATDVQLEGVYNEDMGLIFEKPTFPGAPPRLEDVPSVRGDSWLVVGTVPGPRWEGFEPPRLLSPGVECVDQIHLDSHGYTEPGFRIVWRCTSHITGTTTFELVSGAPEERREELQVVVLSVLHAGFWATLDESLTGLGIFVALGSGGLLLERRYARQITHDDAH